MKLLSSPQYSNEVDIKNYSKRTYPQDRPARMQMAKNLESPNSVLVSGGETAMTMMKTTA